MFLILLGVTILIQEGRTLDIDDFYVKSIISVASHEQKTALFTMSPTKGGMGFKLDRFIVDLKREQIFQIEDGRIPNGSEVIVSHGDNFLFIDHMGDAITHISREGAFVTREPLSRVIPNDVLTGFDLVMATGLGDGDLLFSLVSHREQVIYAVRGNLSENRFEVQHAEELDNDFSRVYWVSDKQGRIYRVNQENGAVAMIEHQDFNQNNVIRKAEEPVMDPMATRAARFKMPKYQYVLYNYRQVDQEIVFDQAEWRDFFGKTRKRPKRKMLHINGPKVASKAFGKLLLQKHGGKTLVYDQNEGTLALN